jgi:hypothetical protein
MAPEQADLNSTPDASWDVYALGAMMFRMLTGQAPHRHDKIIDQIDTAGSLHKRLERYRKAIIDGPPPDQHLSRDDVDRPLARIISKCLAVNPADRYANVQQILQDLSRRDRARAQRPLTLLGIVGPLLILAATCFFGLRSLSRAGNSTRSALRTEAYGSNQLAAAFAARTLESEIDRYFQLTRDEASRAEFVQQLRRTIESGEVRSLLDRIESLQTPLATFENTQSRDRLLEVPARLELDRLLDQRLKRYTSTDPQSRRPRLATMFVTDTNGTILSIAYDQEVSRDENSAGRNFCYRTYFHGGHEDLSKETTTIGQIEPLTWTHLSAAFPSTATRLWKVAVSTPVYLSQDRSRPDALFVVTINLGDFELLQSEQEADHVAVLLEAREGPEQGTILQHPLMDHRRAAGVKMEGTRYKIPPALMQRLLTGGDVNIDYVDPLASAEDGDAYAGSWLAAMQPVSVPREVSGDVEQGQANGAGPNTDLLVLVQYRLEKVIEPVDQMLRALLWEGVAAIASILVVTLTLWVFVRRVGNPGSDPPRNDDQDVANMETLSIR